jgi:hypothetical protein
MTAGRLSLPGAACASPGVRHGEAAFSCNLLLQTLLATFFATFSCNLFQQRLLPDARAAAPGVSRILMMDAF